MQVYFFQSAKDRSLFGFTFNGAGANLPSPLGAWHARGFQLVQANDGMRSTAAVMDGIRADGYCLVVASAMHSSNLGFNHAALPASATDLGTAPNV
jgi:hypothetical protein